MPCLITLSQKELHRLEAIQKIRDHRLSVVQAADMLHLSRSQVHRLLRAYEHDGTAGIALRKRGRPSNRRYDEAFRNMALDLLRERYRDFGPTLAMEKLNECHDVAVSKETLRKWMSEAGIWTSRRERKSSLHQPRGRRDCFGELIQIDDIICANSPQAKGRVERANKTLQDRLVKEMRMRNISTVEAANAYAAEFAADFNVRFGKEPRNPKNMHRPLAAHENLDAAMCRKEVRTLSQAFTLQYDKVLFILDPTEVAKSLAGKKVIVCDFPDGRLEIMEGSASLPYRIFDKLRSGSPPLSSSAGSASAASPACGAQANRTTCLPFLAAARAMATKSAGASRDAGPTL
jgi:transposase